MSRYPILSAAAAMVTLTIFLTWPQALHLDSAIAQNNDPYFSMWRFDWVAHALRVDPLHLYDGNIFYPESRTLAYSDGVLVESLIAVPLLWSGLSPVLVYNLVLLTGIVLSGLSMFVLVRYLTERYGPALVSAAVFTLLPYRVEHFMHLELQWTMWIPLAFWAAHRAVREQSWRLGALCGVFVWLQLLSCVYYGVFLAMTIALLGVLLAVTERPAKITSFTPLLACGLVAGVLAVPYMLPYFANVHTVGVRSLRDVIAYSAHPMSYFTAPRQNWIWGWTSGRYGGNELHLTPGLVVAGLALVGVAGWRSRIVAVYAVVCLVTAELSLGLNGPLYAWLYAHVPALGGLRAIARFSVMPLSALAVLAGFGVLWLQERFPAPRAREWIVAFALLLVAIECGSAPLPLEAVPSATPSVYLELAKRPPGVVAEFPLSAPHSGRRLDSRYEYWSKAHWKPLINGYSGFTSQRYLEMFANNLNFPDDVSIASLRALNVRYVLVHEAFYTSADLARLLSTIGRRPELVHDGRYRDWLGDTDLFELK